jgi:nitrogenase subunit NifH/nitrogenase molybdenum-iron protein alpha/beta subunit
MSHRFAIYGKGGIGKSTLAANLSYGLSLRGSSILHIGCDPKHDSTRLLTDGKVLQTFSDNPDVEPAEPMENLFCIECGGGSCGMGCAGKGIQLLISRLDGVETDYRVYDVLGDVVCGGFSVPMRNENVDGVILVTSGELLSILALNNILKGLENINGGKCVLGIVFNSRGDEDERRLIDIFSQSVGIPIIASIPRDNRFAEAEANGKTVMELFPDSDLSKVFDDIIDRMSKEELELYSPHFIDDDGMELLVHGKVPEICTRRDTGNAGMYDQYDETRNVTYRENIVSPACTSHGAIISGMRIPDVAFVLHGPRNCAYLNEMATYRLRENYRRKRTVPLPDGNIYTSAVDAHTMFKTGLDNLNDAVKQAVDDGFETVFIVPACPPEIAGEDIFKAASELSKEFGKDIRAIRPDRQFLSSKFGATDGLQETLIGMMDTTLPVKKDTVNLIGRSLFEVSTDVNLDEKKRLLKDLGLTINTMFLDRCTLDDIRRFPQGEFDIQVGIGSAMARLADQISEMLGRPRAVVLESLNSMEDYCEWIDTLCGLTGRKELADALKEKYRKEIYDGLSDARRRLKGCKVILYATSRRNLKAELSNIAMLEVDLQCIILDPGTMIAHYEKLPETDVPVYEDGSICMLKEMIKDNRPDLILTNESKISKVGVPWFRFGGWEEGVHGIIRWGEGAADAVHLPTGKGWVSRI